MAPYRYKNIKLCGKCILEHRLVYQRFLGRILRRNEVVHHKDGDGRNNHMRNLELMSLSEHSKLHGLGTTIHPNGVFFFIDGIGVCRKCGKQKPARDFPKNPDMKCGRESRCKDCRNKQRRLNRKINKLSNRF